MSTETIPDLALRAAVASDLLGFAVESGARFHCPVRHLHSKPSAATDARLCLDKVPTLYCFHGSCAGEIERLNYELRSRIGKAEWAAAHPGYDPERKYNGPRIAPKPEGARVRSSFNAAALESVFRPDWSTPLKLAEVSPVTVARVTPTLFLDMLYPESARVLVFTKFTSQGDFLFTRHRFYRLASRPGVQAVPSALRDRSSEGVWFLPQPVTGTWTHNGVGKMTRRSQVNITDWSWMVLEHDPAPGADYARENAQWISFLCQLPLPIAAIYSSGGKSIHALVRLQEVRSKLEWDACKADWVATLAAYGADPAALTAVRLTRLPGCFRGNRKQQLYYFNPAPDLDGVPICEGGYRAFEPRERPEEGTTNDAN